MAVVIGVRFKDVGKVYYFDPGEEMLKKGDKVIVETARGIECGEVAMENRDVAEESIIHPLKKMIRKANEADLKKVEQNEKLEKNAFEICLKKIADHKLEMKLVDVEYTFDNNKILFYFTADGRVDFRELVKDLASVFRTRIELRQIGVRDEAKMLGGLGICGKPFCCSTFLGEFQPVSIKMAKEQGLSLNPVKISGTCGRLMCCLKYEQNVYEDAAKRMPKAESFVQTPDGPGNVKSVDLLRETVKVSLDSAPEPLKCYHNCEVCVLRNGKGSREGIAIPERPARYVEPKEAEEFREEAPALMPPFYMDTQLEEAPMREKIGAPGSGDGKPRRRHRGGRRRGGAKSGEGVEQPKAEARGPEKKEGRPRPPKQESRPAQPKLAEARPGENRAAAPDGEGEAKRRRRPHHRGGRRRNKNGGEGGGSAPKSE